MTKKNTKPARKDTAQKAAPLPTNWETTLTSENAWIVRELAKRENVTDEEAYGRILNAGLKVCGEIVPLPRYVDPKWAAAMADPERKERIKRMEEERRNRPTLEQIGVTFEDTGSELLVRVGGRGYEVLCKTAEAINKTLGSKYRATAADVFGSAVMLETVLTLPKQEMYDAICNDWFCYPDEPGHAEQVAALRKHLRAVGLFEDRWCAPAKKKSSKRSKKASK